MRGEGERREERSQSFVVPVEQDNFFQLLASTEEVCAHSIHSIT